MGGAWRLGSAIHFKVLRWARCNPRHAMLRLALPRDGGAWRAPSSPAQPTARAPGMARRWLRRGRTGRTGLAGGSAGRDGLESQRIAEAGRVTAIPIEASLICRSHANPGLSRLFPLQTPLSSLPPAVHGVGAVSEALISPPPSSLGGDGPSARWPLHPSVEQRASTRVEGTAEELQVRQVSVKLCRHTSGEPAPARCDGVKLTPRTAPRSSLRSARLSAPAAASASRSARRPETRHRRGWRGPRSARAARISH